MRSSRVNGAPAGSRLAAGAATVAAPLLVFLIVKTTLSAASPAAAVALSSLPPSDPSPALRQVLRAAQSPKFKVSAPVAASGREALADAPLAFEPFYIAARAAEQAGRLDRATSLLEEAKRRRPSYPAVRMRLVVYYAQARRYEEALSEIDWLLERDLQLRTALLPELLKLLSVPEGRTALAALLAKEPDWRSAFADAAATRKVNPQDALALYEAVKARKPGGDLDIERHIVLHAQIGSGAYQAARNTALAAVPANERAANALLFDPDFRGVRSLKPFTWSLVDNEVGRAERAREGNSPYLDVSFFGGRDALLAEQVLALPPGQYSLRTAARRQGSEHGARLFWQIVCLPDNTPVTQLDLPGGAGNPAPAAARFTIPAGCAGQALRMMAEAGEVASSITAQVSRVEIRQ